MLKTLKNLQDFFRDPQSQIGKDIGQLLSMFKTYLLRTSTLVDEKINKKFSKIIKVEMLKQINDLWDNLDNFDPAKEKERIKKTLDDENIQEQLELLTAEFLSKLENPTGQIS